MNLAQLRIQIDRRTGVRQDPLAANSYINEAVNNISSYREWPWLDALQTITTTEDENTYSVPAAYSETRTFNINGIEATQIYIADADEFSAASYCPANYEYAIEWTSGAGTLQIFPTPPEGTVALHRYVRTEPTLSADTSEPLIPERYHSVICDHAAGLFLERVDSTRSELYMERARKGLKQMAEGVQRRTNTGRIRIRPGSQY